ncbi:MAG: SCO family protein [Gallionellaceae bacterium]|nr:SCO family protein [Gallionellaceae bacterium]
MRVLQRLLCLVLLASLAGCGPDKRADFKGTDITGADFGRQLSLTDHNGVKRSLADFRAKLVVLFFGYTHCPDVCPTTLSDMASAFKLMPPADAKQVQVLFVSVDPERDTPDMLKQYVPYFHPSFLGLYGTPDEIAVAAKEFRIHYRKHVEPGATDYLVDHTAGSYVLDREGRLRLFLPYAQPPADIAHDLDLLLRE